MSIELEAEWSKVTENVSEPIRKKWWTDLVKNYNEPTRGGHNFDKLENKFCELNDIRPHITNVNAFILALFFQYFYYDSKDSELYNKNLEIFEKFSTEAGLFESNSELYEKTKELLDVSSAYSTEEHLVEGAYGNKDIHYFLDLDMVCLGFQPDKYKEHAQAIAQEYAFLDPPSYKKLRQKVLRSFLLIPNIYATKVFRDKYEKKARENIDEELNQLK